MAFLDSTGAAYLVSKIKDNTLTYKGSITASSNLTELTAGMYTISGVTHSRFPTTNAPYYGILIQTGGTYKTQMLLGGLAGESRCYSRRWVSGTTWTGWTKTVSDAELSASSASGIKNVSVTLTANGWSASAPYYQDVNVTGMTSSWIPGTPVCDFSNTVPSDSDFRDTMDQVNLITVVQSESGYLRFYAHSEKPTIALTLIVPGGAISSSL